MNTTVNGVTKAC